MEKVMNLFERFVVSQERIAEALSRNPTRIAAENHLAQQQAALTDKGPTSKYPAEDDRAAWVEMCNVRGIGIPKGTKTPTLVRNVKTWDVAHPEGVQTPGPTEETLGEKTPFDEEEKPATKDPFDQGEGEADPLKDTEPEPEKVTKDQVLAALQAVHKKEGCGNPAVIKILKEKGGVEKLGELDEKHYAAVIKAAKGVVNG